MASSPSVSELFTHIHQERMVSVFEDAPEFVVDDRHRIAQMLNESAKNCAGCGKRQGGSGARHEPEL